MDPNDAFIKFVQTSGAPHDRFTALAFFVGYAYGSTGVKESIDALVAGFKEAESKLADK